MSEEIKETFIEVIESDENLATPVDRKKMTGSMIEILPIPSAQSFCIKLGNTIEKCFNEYIVRMGVEIISDTMLDNRQADLYFEYNDDLYYFESKNNVNLDSEKSPAVSGKIFQMEKEVDIVGCLSFRAATKKELSKWASGKLVSYLYGYNDFFEIFEDKLEKNEYNEILNCIGNVYKKMLGAK